MISMFLLALATIGALTMIFGAKKPTADQQYGCSVKEQKPSGDCP